jgi:hypothetical protein
MGTPATVLEHPEPSSRRLARRRLGILIMFTFMFMVVSLWQIFMVLPTYKRIEITRL